MGSSSSFKHEMLIEFKKFWSSQLHHCSRASQPGPPSASSLLDCRSSASPIQILSPPCVADLSRLQPQLPASPCMVQLPCSTSLSELAHPSSLAPPTQPTAHSPSRLPRQSSPASPASPARLRSPSYPPSLLTHASPAHWLRQAHPHSLSHVSHCPDSTYACWQYLTHSCSPQQLFWFLRVVVLTLPLLQHCLQ